VTARARLSRRTALASAALSPLALGACDIDPPRRDEPASGDSSPASPTPSDDALLVASLVTAITEAEGVVAAVRSAHPDLAPALDPLATAHSAHRELLAEAAPEVSGDDPVATGAPAARAAALAAVRRVERRLQRQVSRGCTQAASGDLARVLASITGSLAQHAVALEAPPAEVTP
jgi:hypothetical protein